MTTWEREDVLSIIGGLFDANVKLDRIARDLAAIRHLLDDDEEEAQEDD